ncbi:MAG: hypothetical protein ACP5N9_03515 [Candidatus Bilamarchaeum sp.]|jgi:hypothetical protein
MASFRKHPITNYALLASSAVIVGSIAFRSCHQTEPIRTNPPIVRACPPSTAAPVVTPPNKDDGICEPQKGEADIRSPKYDQSCGRCGDGIRQVATEAEIPQASADAGVPADSGLSVPNVVRLEASTSQPRTRGQNTVYYQVVEGIVSETVDNCPIDFMAGDGFCNSNAGNWIAPQSQLSAMVISDGAVVLRPTARTETDGGITRFVEFNENDPSNQFYYPLDCYRRPLVAQPRETLPGCPAVGVTSNNLDTTAPGANRYLTLVTSGISSLASQIRAQFAGHGVTNTSDLKVHFSVVIEPNGEVANPLISVICNGSVCGGQRELPSNLVVTPVHGAATPQSYGVTRCSWEFNVNVPQVSQ